MHEMHLRGQGCRERYASLAYGLLRSFLRHARSYTVTSVFYAKAAANTTLRVDRANSFTPMSLSREATLLVSDGGVIPSFFAARLNLTSCAIVTMKILTSIGFLFCIQTFLDEFGEETPRAFAIFRGLRNALSSILTPVCERGPADGEDLPAASGMDFLAICAKLSLWRPKSRHYKLI